jgi:hypothetical protein
MAYATSNPPRLTQAAGIGQVKNFWFYTSADAFATVDGSGYFTNGYNLGMRDGDIITVYDTANKIASMHVVINTSGTTIDLANGTTVGTATNSD